MAKISISRLFEAGPVIQAFQKAKIEGLEAFITFLSDFSEQVIRALRSRLTIEENMASQVEDVELSSGVSQQVYLLTKAIQPRHVIVTKSSPFSTQITAFNWQIRMDGNIDVVATFTPAPASGKITARIVVLY